jgi:uncharacterized protein
MRSSRSFLAWTVLAVLMCLPASGTTVDAIPRPPPGSWSVDMTGTLRPKTLAKVNRLGTQLDASGQGQLAVVVVGSTEGVPPRAFATGLFNHWGIGHAKRSDGVLLFVALDDQKAEIILGDGVDTAGNVERSDALMARLVPLFADGEPDAAVLEGARGLGTLLAPSLPNTGVRQEARSASPSGAVGLFLVLALLFTPALLVRLLFWHEEKTGRPWDARPQHRHGNVFIPPTSHSSGGGFSGGGSFGGGSSSGSGSSGSW